MYKISQKLVATMILTVMLLAQMSLIGIYSGEVIAAESAFETQGTKTNNQNVEFDAYFMNGNNKVHEASKKIDEENSIYLSITSNNGYLKEANVKFVDENNNNANFKLKEVQNNLVQVVDSQNSTISLNQINNGDTKTIEIPIVFNYAQEISPSEFLKLSKAIFTGTYVDSSGKENKIEKEIKLALTWKTDIEEREDRSIVKEAISKFIPYEDGKKEGVILQTTINTAVKDNVLPVKTTTIEIEVPTINNIKPESIKVYATSTKATNGDETGYSFNEENYTYNEETNKLTITVENKLDENGKISWKKDSQDEYKVTYIFPKEVKNLIEEGVKVELNTKITTNLYDAENIRISNTIRNQENLKETIGKITDFKIESLTQNLSKGYIYANYVATEKTETIYKENVVAEVADASLVNGLVLEPKQESLISNDETTKNVVAEGETYYKNIKINKADLNKILGENLEVKIYNGEEVVSTINKETLETAEDTITVDLLKLNLNNIKIETSAPVTEGMLTFEVEKAIKNSLGYTKAQMQDIKLYNVTLSGKDNIEEVTVEDNIEFVEPETKAELVINKESLSTVVKNENVELKAILHTDSINNNLFKNPTITITLPKYIENVEIKDTKLLFDNDLKITGTAITTNANGEKVITINLAGEQTKYSIDSVTGGANIVITADLTVNKLTANRTENVTMTYTNENEPASTRTKEAQAQINFVAPVGVVTTSSIENYAEGKEKLTAISGENLTAEINRMQDKRDVKFDMSVINNYNNTISNPVILGRIATKGNKDLVTGEDLKNTFDVILKSAIDVSGIDASKVQVYYSTNKDATKDLNVAANGWVSSVENYETVKSYLIVVTGDLNTSEAVNFIYTAELPEKLEYNETSVENYIVYFTNNLATGAIEDSKKATQITITTGLGAVLETNITSNIPQDQVVLSGNKIKYTVTVKNTGTKSALNAKIAFNVPNNTQYIEYEDLENDVYKTSDEKVINYDIAEIKPNETVTKDFYVQVLRNISNQAEYEIETSATITADDLEAKQTNKITNKVKNAVYNISLYRETETYENLEPEEQFIYIFYVSTSNPSTKTENTVFTTTIPEGLIYKNSQLSIYNPITNQEESTQIKPKYNEKTRVLTVDLGTLEGNNGRKITVNTTVDALRENEYSKDIEIIGNVATGNINESSQPKQFRIVREGLEIVQTASIPNGSVISAGEEIEYTINLKNIGAKTLQVKVKDVLPEGLIFENLKYDLDGKTMNYSTTSNNTVEDTFYVKEGETRTLVIKVVAQIVEQDTKVTNIVTAQTSTLSNVKSNEITYTIETTKYVPLDNNSENNTPEDNKTALVKLGGTVWKDENKNGIKEANEELLANIEVMLLNTTTNSLFTQNGNIVKAKTNANGIYTFENVPSGNYIAIFLYDTQKYSTTTYKVENADETVNSDARDSKIIIDGIITTVALTNTIELKESNLYNIDLGLVDNPKFDLSLTKTISKVTVQNEAGTNIYEYENSNLAKVEFVEKYLEGTTIVVEYTIKVTNEGAVEGYVKKIADYLPSELSFSSELNRDWYENGNGTIYNSSLANTLIKPGETKEVKLLLTKTINANSLGTINNRAEIYEAYNDLGLNDVDSNSANQNSNEDDYSSSDLVLSIKTGKMITFIGLTIAIIAIIGTSAYIIKKKVLR